MCPPSCLLFFIPNQQFTCHGCLFPSLSPHPSSFPSIPLPVHLAIHPCVFSFQEWHNMSGESDAIEMLFLLKKQKISIMKAHFIIVSNKSRQIWIKHAKLQIKLCLCHLNTIQIQKQTLISKLFQAVWHTNLNSHYFVSQFSLKRISEVSFSTMTCAFMLLSSYKKKKRFNSANKMDCLNKVVTTLSLTVK